MHPILFKIGSIPIYTYGLMIALGFMFAMEVVKRLAAKNGLPVERVVDLSFWCLITGLIGARLLFVITRLDYFITDPIAIFKIWEGGLVFYGGPIAALAFGIHYTRKHRLPFWKLFDTLIPGLVLAHAFGRFGCLGAGCCYGKPTGTGFGIKLNSELVDAEFRGINLHPTQLYEAVSLLILFAGLLFLHKRKSFDGQVGITYLMIYPIIRSIIEIYRGDTIRGFVIDDVLSTSQFISILVFIMAILLLKKRAKTAAAKSAH